MTTLIKQRKEAAEQFRKGQLSRLRLKERQESPLSRAISRLPSPLTNSHNSSRR